MRKSYLEHHEKQSAEYVRSTHEAVAEYERVLADPQTKEAERDLVGRALASVRRTLPEKPEGNTLTVDSGEAFFPC